MEILKYKEFEGSADLDMNRNVCRGKILYIDDVVTYESKSIDDLQKQFEEAVDDYIETCKQIGKEPQKPCRGQFNVRVSSELHRAATRRSIADDTSLNDVVCKALEAYLTTATSAVSVAVQGVSMVGANVRKEVITPAIDPAELSRVYGSAAVTAYLIPNPFFAETPNLKIYRDTIGSVEEALPEIQERRYAH